jgi:hypothetical protein
MGKLTLENREHESLEETNLGFIILLELVERRK